MATTAGGLITAAFIKIGIGSPTAAQTASALISLNNMMSMMGAEFLYPSLIIEDFTLTDGTAEYTIGSGGDLDTTYKPIKIESAFLRDSDSMDWPLRIISGVDVNSITSKTVEAKPASFYFIPEVTLAKVIFECEADYAYGFHIQSWKNFTEFPLTTTALTVPNEYKEFFVYNLAVSLGEDFDRLISKTVLLRARETKNIIDTLGASTRVIPRAKFDFLGGRRYDIDSDT